MGGGRVRSRIGQHTWRSIAEAVASSSRLANPVGSLLLETPTFFADRVTAMSLKVVVSCNTQPC